MRGFAEIVKERNDLNRLAEIGCGKLDNARDLLLWCETLTGIDPFLYDSESQDKNNVIQWEQDNRYVRACQLMLSKRGFIILRLTSLQAAALFPDEFFDGVYIDANHKYEHVKQDITLWLPKVRKGGVLAGHDYWSLVDPEVKTAVDECLETELRKQDWIYRKE